jgi:hypothetical protein
MKTLAFTLTVSLLLLTQCQWFDDDDNPIDKLPPATQTGKNIFACLIDGQPWFVIWKCHNPECFFILQRQNQYFVFKTHNFPSFLSTLRLFTNNSGFKV